VLTRHGCHPHHGLSEQPGQHHRGRRRTAVEPNASTFTVVAYLPRRDGPAFSAGAARSAAVARRRPAHSRSARSSARSARHNRRAAIWSRKRTMLGRELSAAIRRGPTHLAIGALLLGGLLSARAIGTGVLTPTDGNNGPALTASEILRPSLLETRFVVSIPTAPASESSAPTSVTDGSPNLPPTPSPAIGRPTAEVHAATSGPRGRMGPSANVIASAGGGGIVTLAAVLFLLLNGLLAALLISLHVRRRKSR
jgi:hypothetical protein